MLYQVTNTPIDSVIVLAPKMFGDARDFEHDTGLKETFVQENHSKSAKDMLRGLHCQVQHAQGKLLESRKE